MMTSKNVDFTNWRGLSVLVLLAVGLLFPARMTAQTLPYNFDFTTDPFANGWTQVSVTGAQMWNYNASFSNASMSAFAGGCQVNEDWLITPAFNLTSTTSEVLSFDVQRGFAGDNGLEVLYSTNYSGVGDPNAATWTAITNITSQFFTDNSIPNNTSSTFGPFSELQAANAAAVYVAFKFDYQVGGCSTWRVAGFSLVSATAPSITASTTSIGNLNYEEGTGPSQPQQYTISGSNLTGTGNIVVAAPAGFQVSLNNVFYSNSVNVPFGSGIITGQPRSLWVRLNANQAIGDYNGNITHTGGGSSATVAVSGSVSQAGTYIVDFEGPGETKASYASADVSLSGLQWNLTEVLIGTEAADFKNGLRSARMRGYGTTSMSLVENKPGGIGTLSFVYAVYGSDPQTPFVAEYSTDNGATWVQIGAEFTATVAPATFFESVNVSDDVRVRFRTVTDTGTSNRRMNIDDITITDFGVANAQVFATPGSLIDFGYTIGEGPSAAQSYTLSAVGLTPASGNIAVTAPSGFQVSPNGTTWSASLNVAYADGGTTIANNTVFVRLAGGLASGTYSGNVTNTAGTGSAQVSVSGAVSASPLPDLFNLSGGDYNFTEWSSESSAGSFPANMRFNWSNDPSATDFNPLADGTGLYNCGYNLTSRPRVNGNGETGFSFITTGSPQYNNCSTGAADLNRFVGSAVIGLNTSGVNFARISWLNRYLVEGTRDFAVRLQYRIGNSGDYVDFAGTPEYNTIGKTVGDTATANFILPAAVLNQGEVYLRLIYFQLGTGSGNRPELGVDEINITTAPLTTPLLGLSASSISNLYYAEGAGPSAPAAYTLQGANLSPASGAITVTAPANFQLSLNGTTYSNSLNIGYNGGNVNQQIFVRLVAELPVGLYPGGSISHAGGNAATVNLSVSGEVGYPVNLGVGDVSIIGYRSVANDGIAFANWVPLPNGTVILFTDRGFTGSQLLTNENLCVWTNNTGSTIPAGTVVKIGGPEFENGAGVNVGVILSGNLDGLAQGGDNIFALQGSVNQPSWVYGLSYLSPWLTEGAVTNPTSYLPAALNVPTGNIVISDPNALNAQYNADRTNQPTFAAYKTLVSDAGNWLVEIDGGLFGDFNTAPFVIGGAACTANGGTLATAATRSYCVGTGSPQGISVQVTGASGTNQRWGLINAAGDVVAFRSNNSNFNLDIYPPGNYTIRYIRYENDVNIASVSNISDVANLTGCYGISSNAINLFLRPEPTGGILSANTATTVCTGGGAASIVQVALTGATGENFRYGVVDQSLGNQVVQNQASANVNFSTFAPGTYRIFNISFQQGVSLVGVEFQSDLQGCYDLSNPVVVSVVNCLAAELSSAPNPTASTSFVTFTNPREEYTTLEVYDMSGRMVQRLFNQVTIADQPYRIEFDGNGLSNGVYLYRLTTDSEVVVDKFMIAR